MKRPRICGIITLMSDKAKITVIIPVHNACKYVDKAIDSALNQDVSLKVIVIDDKSSDDIDRVMDRYAGDDRVIYEKNDTNLGVAATRNRGVCEADTEYIAFLDADDIWREGKLSSQLSAMEDEKAVLSSTARELMDINGDLLGRVIPIPERIEYKDILKHNMISCSAVVVRTDVMRAHPMEHDDSHEDYIAWINIIREHGFAIGIDKPYLMYRMSSTGKSGSRLKSAKMTYKAYRYAGFGVLRSIRYFISYAYNGVKKYYG